MTTDPVKGTNLAGGDIAVIVIYFAVVLGFGLYVSQFKQKKNQSKWTIFKKYLRKSNLLHELMITKGRIKKKKRKKIK